MPSSLEIDSVRFEMSGGQLEDIQIGGRVDIFNHPEVKRFRKQGGKIVSVSGEFQHDGRKFKFKTSYAPSTGLGRVQVEKKGRRTGDLEVRQEGFDFIYEEFENYFIDN
jgi:hypothetical protein